MNRFYSILIIIIGTIAISTAQVGIGTNTPDNSSLLDIESTEKGFLPPRMTEGERDNIVNPAEGLIIYNKTAHCLQANIATDHTHNWSPCLTGDNSGTDPIGGNGELQGMVPWETPLTFQNYHTSSTRFNTIAVTTAGNVYGWGLESRHLFHGYDKTATVGDNIPNGSSRMDSPFFIDDDLWNGKAKVARGYSQVNYFVVTTEGKLYGWGAESNNILNTGTSGNLTTSSGTRKATEIPPHANSAAANYVDILIGEQTAQGFIIALMDDGTLYFRGGTYAGESLKTTWFPINAPEPGVSYTRILSNENRNIENFTNFFVEGSNGKVYSIGGNGSTATSGANRGNPSVGYPVTGGLNGSINEVLFPAGVINGVGSITKISTSGNASIALASDGKAYGWGDYRNNISTRNHVYLVASEANMTTLGANRIFAQPEPILFPTGVTAFDDVAVNRAGTFSGSLYTAGNVVYFGGSAPIDFNNLIYNTDDSAPGYKILFSSQGIAARNISVDNHIISFLSPSGVFYGLGRSTNAVTGSIPGTISFTRPVATPLYAGNLDPGNTSVGPGN